MNQLLTYRSFPIRWSRIIRSIYEVHRVLLKRSTRHQSPKIRISSISEGSSPGLIQRRQPLSETSWLACEKTTWKFMLRRKSGKRKTSVLFCMLETRHPSKGNHRNEKSNASGVARWSINNWSNSYDSTWTLLIWVKPILAGLGHEPHKTSPWMSLLNSLSRLIVVKNWVPYQSISEEIHSVRRRVKGGFQTCKPTRWKLLIVSRVEG